MEQISDNREEQREHGEDVLALPRVMPEQKLVPSVFFALSSIDKNLALDEPLKQRVALRYRLGSMKPEATADYVRHRLKIAGCDRELFDPGALKLVHQYSRGIPRLINVLCDNSLFEAFLVRKEVVGEEIVEGVAEDLGLQKVVFASGGKRVMAPKDHLVPPPEGLNREEMETLGLIEEQEGG